MSNNNVQPVFILPEGSVRNTGRTAQKSNIAAARAVADAVRTTLGPKGMDKMIVSSMGEVVVTNDGVTILEEMDIEHPAAKMIVEVAKVQESEVGDGTTSAVVLCGELLKRAEILLDKNLHPTVIAKGYELAAKQAQDVLKKMSEPVDIAKKSTLKNVAVTAMTGKNVEFDTKQKLAKIAVDAVISIIEKRGKQAVLDIDNIKIEKKEGTGTEGNQLISGIVIDKERVHPSMPMRKENTKVLLLDTGLEAKSTEMDAKISITSPDQLQAFLDQEENTIKAMVDQIAKTGADVVFSQKGMDDTAQHFLAKHGIFAVRRVKESDISKLARATGAKIVSSLADISKSDLGSAGIVEERKISGESMVFVEKCKNPKAVTILVRGGTTHVVAEVERALKDAIGDLSAAISDGACVAGGGSVEAELSKQLKNYATSFSGREQLGVRAFAESLEAIPETLAENAGLDSINVLTDLKSQHKSGKKWAGINVFTGKIEDMWKRGVIEPLRIKKQAIDSASDAAIMLLRIDDVIAAAKTGNLGGPAGGMPQGMPGGMPQGMPGMM